jgi:CRP/FNR family cyclic AMP-dependent transcriptional regulator
MILKEEKNKAFRSSFWANIFHQPDEKSDLRISLSSIPLFESFGKRDLSFLLHIIHNRNYLTGEFIFYQGDPGIGLYLIRDGEVQIIREDEAGNQIILATFSKGDFFGELALVDGEKRSASAIAITDVRAAVIFKPDLDEFILKYPKKGINILNGISQIVVRRLRSLNEDFFSLQSHNKSGVKHGT